VTSDEETEEAQFVARLVARDESAFNELVVLYERRVFALVYRMIGRRDEAEDLAQEVFVQVFKAIDQFRGESKLSTWIFRIAVNCCKNRSKYLSLRKSQDLREIEERVSGDSGKGVIFGGISRPDEMLEGQQLEVIVKEAIARVEPDFREILILRDVEDMSYPEMSAVTGVSEGTLKSRLYRARAQLREQVERALAERLRSNKR
jgi:RNA polymerase sigma-70 factor (ECF subfamily)